MFEKLVWKCYGTKDLDWVARRFMEQTEKVPEVFVVRDGWKVFGRKKNLNKVLVSRFGAFACVSVPLYLNREQIMALDAARVINAKVKVEEERITSDEEGNYQFSYTRHCNYCGRLYGTHPINVVTHCSAPNCVEKHREYEKHRREIRESQKKEESITNNHTPSFSLDDPTSPTLGGWVYLIESENGLFKIGRSNDIGRRFGDLVCSSPVPLFLRHTIYSDNYVNAERYLHKEFALQVHHGEWHRLTAEDVDWILGLSDHTLDRA